MGRRILMTMSESAKAARREYMRQYRLINGERIREQNRERYAKKPEKYKEQMQRYWEKKALKMASK
jgi:hypothetical protein